MRQWRGFENDVFRRCSLYNGLGPGFDFARILLALAVLFFHAFGLPNGNYDALMGSGFWILNFAVLPMFFGLSGFLVAASAQRLSLANFALNRGLRILPALIVEVALSAFLIGPIFTHLPLGEYFSNELFYRYLMNMVAIISFHLPGVFIDNIHPRTVNGSLWTVPFELICYFAMAYLIVSRAVCNAKLLFASALAAVLVGVGMQLEAMLFPEFQPLKGAVDLYVRAGKGAALLPCFLLGSSLYALRYKIRYDWRIFIVCIILLMGFGTLAPASIWEMTPIVLFVAPLMIYIACFVGLLKIPEKPYFKRGDYSYGIYLYGYPIQQSLVATSDFFHSALTLGGASFLLATAFATASWHVIEKPVLKRRKRFSFVANPP